MADTSYSVIGIHLPENVPLVRTLRRSSLLLNSMLAVLAAVLLLLWYLSTTVVSVLFYNPLFESVVYLFAAISLLFSAKHVHGLTKSASMYGYLARIIPIICGIAIAAFGGMLWFQSGQLLYLIGLNFISIGISTLLPHVRIIIRFHVIQLLALVILFVSAVSLLGDLYLFNSHTSTMQIFHVSLGSACLAMLYSFGLLIRWPSRGLLGIFTSDSVIGIYALRMLSVSLITMPVIGYIETVDTIHMPLFLSSSYFLWQW
jgi:hypothetical protein